MSLSDSGIIPDLAGHLDNWRLGISNDLFSIWSDLDQSTHGLGHGLQEGRTVEPLQCRLGPLGVGVLFCATSRSGLSGLQSIVQLRFLL